MWRQEGNVPVQPEWEVQLSLLQMCGWEAGTSQPSKACPSCHQHKIVIAFCMEHFLLSPCLVKTMYQLS